MSNMSKSAEAKRVQYAALPFRQTGRSRTEVMLVTSRGTRRWIIPKGWPHKGKAPHDSAAREAFEEAGVVGAVGKRAVGSFPYQSAFRWNQPSVQVQDPRPLVRPFGSDGLLGRGHMLADVSAIIGSLDIVFGEIDR
jgi:8-oxo-dGTP pyrophosphatase MutT (NUDIX family)